MRPVTAVLLLAVAACSSKAYAPTILVVNATCNVGQCVPLQVLAYDQTIQSPSVPGGWWFSLGLVNSSSACLTFPPSGDFRVNGRSVATFTVADAFTLTARDTLLLVPTRQTATFVPQDAPGWSVAFDTFPVNPIGPVAMATACTP